MKRHTNEMEPFDIDFRLNLLESKFEENLKKGISLIDTLSPHGRIKGFCVDDANQNTKFPGFDEKLREMDILVPVHIVSSLDCFLKELAPCVVIAYLEGCYQPVKRVRLKLPVTAFKAFLSDYTSPQEYSSYGLRYMNIYRSFERNSYQSWEAIASLLKDLGVGHSMKNLIEVYLNSRLCRPLGGTMPKSYDEIKEHFETIVTLRHDAAHRQGSLLKTFGGSESFCGALQGSEVNSVAVVGKSVLMGIRENLLSKRL